MIGRTARPALVGLALVGLLLGTAASATADSPHDVDFTADGDHYIWSFGYPDTATYGQTITVPAGVATIQTFSFVMDVPAGLVFRGAVQAWDGDKATGPVLYLSDPTSTSGDGYDLVTFGPDVAVTPGVYVLYGTISYDYATNAVPGVEGVPGYWSSILAAPYDGGAMVWDNNRGDIDRLTTRTWDNRGGGYVDDMAFAVTFGLPAPADPADPVTADPAFTG